MSSYVFVTDDEEFERRARQALNLTNGEIRRLSTEQLSADPGASLARLTEHGGRTTRVLGLGPGLPPEVVLRIAERVDELHPDVTLLLVVDERWDATLLERAMQAGIRDVVPTDSDEGMLASSLHRAAQLARRRGQILGQDRDGPTSRVLIVLSPKGGSGKTAVATNLATGLAQTLPNEVVLVDLDLAFGDVASALGMVPEHSVATAARSIGDMDLTALKVFLTPHQSGLLTLCAPEDPSEGDAVQPRAVAELISALSVSFPFVVVDTSAGISEHTLATLEFATDLVLVCTMDVASIRSLTKLVVALDELGHTQQPRTFVLNRASSRVGLSTTDIERTVGLPAAVAVPSHRSIPLSMNRGQPLVTAKMRSPARRPLAELSEHFLELVAEQPRSLSTLFVSRPKGA